MAALMLIEAVAIVLLGVLVAGLLRSHAEILRTLHRLGADPRAPAPFQAADGAPPPFQTRDGVTAPRPGPGGEAAHDISGAGLDDEAVAVAVASTGRPTLLAFLTSGCTTCARFWSAFREGHHTELPGAARLVIVTRSADEESPSELRRLAAEHLPVILSTSAWNDYGVPGSPYFAYVDAAGYVAGEGAAESFDQLVSLLGQALTDRSDPTGVQPASPALADPDDMSRIDAELAAAGIYPGHPSLYGEDVPGQPGGDRG